MPRFSYLCKVVATATLYFFAMPSPAAAGRIVETVEIIETPGAFSVDHAAGQQRRASQT